MSADTQTAKRAVLTPRNNHYDGVKRETGKRMNIVKDRTFDCPLPKVIDDAHAIIAEQLREFQFLGDDGLFKVVPEYPEFNWFEGR